MSIKIITPAVAEPLSLSDVKTFLRVDSSAEDTLISAMITASRQLCEQYMRRILITTTIEEYFDYFPPYKFGQSDIIYLSAGPVQSITSVKYLDGVGTEITVNASKYRTDIISEPARIISTDGWFDTEDTINVVTVRSVVGYSAASDVPGPIKQAMLLIIADMYEKRQDSIKQMPTASEYLMKPYRIFTF